MMHKQNKIDSNHIDVYSFIESISFVSQLIIDCKLH